MGQIALLILSGLLVILNIGPMYLQILQGNSGPISMGIWVILENLNDFIGTLVWYNNSNNPSPVWCDISVKIQMGGEVGRIASVLCIARFLAEVVSPWATASTREDRRRRVVFDYSLCFGFPALVMACHIVYQPNRFSIVRGVGCQITDVMSWPTLVLWLIWPPILAVLGICYSSYTIYRLIRHRRNFGKVVAGTHSALTTSRFIRLAVVSVSYLVVALPLCLYTFSSNLESSGLYFDYSWTYLHDAWNLIPFTIIDNSSNVAIPTLISSVSTPTLWGDVIAGAFFFAAFGFGADALSTYSSLIHKLSIKLFGSTHLAVLPMAKKPNRTTQQSPPNLRLADNLTREQNGIKIVVVTEKSADDIIVI